MTARFPVLALLVTVAVLAMPSRTLAQRFPFFVQPISVKDLKPMADELKLSPDQAEAMIGFHEIYGKDFTGLQEGELDELIDKSMAVAKDMNWMARQLNIPPRKEIESIIKAAEAVWAAFERIDNRFFMQVRSLLHEEQFAAIERIQNRRRVDAYRSLHLRLVESLNDGAGADLVKMLDRLELSELERESLNESLQSYERDIVKQCKKLQKRILDATAIVLDEVDRLGIRDMEMMEMMAFMTDPERQDELKAIVDLQSVPIQEVAADLSEINWKTYRKVYPLLPSEAAIDLQERYFREVYRGTGDEVFTARAWIKRAMDLPSVDAAQKSQMKAVLDQLNIDFESLSSKISKAIESKRALRTMDVIEGDVPSEHQPDIDRYKDRSSSMASKAEERVRMLLTSQQQELLDGEEVEESGNDRSRWARRGGRGGRGGSTRGSGGSGRRGSWGGFPVEAMEMDRVNRFALWVGIPSEEMPRIEAIHLGYMSDYETLSESYQTSLDEAYEAMEEGEGRGRWMKRRSVRNEVTERYRQKLLDRENTLFGEFEILLPEGTDPKIIGTIRRAQDRDRVRSGQQQSGWALRQNPESTIDLASILLSVDPVELDQKDRLQMVGLIADYEEQITGDLELLNDQLEKLQSIQGRLWSGEEYEQDIRGKMESLRQKRQKEVGETAIRLTVLNRDALESMIKVLPDDSGWYLQEEYDKNAFSEVFEDYTALDDIIEQCLASESVSPAERQTIETMAMDHRMKYRGLTNQMLEMAKSRAALVASWPPNPDMMDGWMKSEQLEFERGELNGRTRARLQLLLGDERAIEIDGLMPDMEDMLQEDEVEIIGG